jgi:hypothetical protein
MDVEEDVGLGVGGWTTAAIGGVSIQSTGRIEMDTAVPSICLSGGREACYRSLLLVEVFHGGGTENNKEAHP